MSEKSNVKVKISSDEYQAYMTITYNPAESLSLNELGPLLKEHGIVFGIKKDVLMIIVDRYKKGVFIDNILVAEGIRPFEGVKPSIDFKFKLSSEPKTDASGRINYREISKILNITQNQLLAVKHKPTPPVQGMTVTGKRTTFPPINDIPLHVGENIVKEEHEDVINYKAGVDGALKFENYTLSVFPTLDIKEDVDFNVGNIRFKGDVKIGRDVLPDFIVEAEGKVSIWGSAIACQVIASDGIEVRAGIVGKNKGEAISGEDITAAFVENAKLKAEYDIMIKSGIIGSEVHCGGSLTLEIPRSRIVGSIIQAGRGILAYNVGSRFDTSSQLITGIHADKEKEYLKIKEHLNTKLNEAKELEKKHGRTVLEKKDVGWNATPQVRDDMVKWDILKKELQMISQRLKQTEEAMYDYQAIIQVKETLYPRVILKIGRHQLTSDKEYHNIKVRYSEEEDRLVIE